MTLDENTSSNPRDATLAAQPAEAQNRSVGAARGKVSIVEGERKTLSAQEQETLRARLRAATVVILFGFGIYLVRSYFDDRPLQGFHTFVVFALFAALAVLTSRRELTTKHLRLLELLIFGLPVVFFVPYHYFCMMQQVEADDPVGIVAIYKNVSSYWFCLLVIYGLFIPNTWKRTAIVVTPMVILPVLTGFVASARHDAIGEHLDLRQLTDTLMILGVGALCASYGAEVIRSLRQEAREAKQFGQYRLLETIGKGGMGKVYKAEHQLLKRPCAIKLILPERTGDPAVLARFEREVRTTAKLTHWNTIEIYDYGRTDDGAFYYVMEYLPGMNLRQLMKASGPLPPARTVFILSQICGALGEAHTAALIHRDINAGNIFITQRGGVYDVAKLLDFGLVKEVENPEATQLTQMGAISGTPKYMSPEQASSSESPDARSDIYSLGAVAYEMLAGRAPFEGSTPLKIMIAHSHDPVPPLRKWNESIPAELEAIVLRCLEKKPGDRFPNAESLHEALAVCPLQDTWDRHDAARWWKQHESAEPVPDEGLATEVTQPFRQADTVDT